MAVENKRLNKSSVPTFELLAEDNVREGFMEKGDFEAILSHLQDGDVQDVVTWAFGQE